MWRTSASPALADEGALMDEDSIPARRDGAADSSMLLHMTEQSVLPATATESVAAGIPAFITHDAPRASEADATANALPLLVDNSAPIEVGDLNDPLPPFPASIAASKLARARASFEKFGIQYEEDAQQRPDGRCHIQRLIRIRLHWECHRCRTEFGNSPVCAKCGHDRCEECSRSPAPRVREFLGDTMLMQQVQEQAAQAGTEEDTVLMPVAIGAEASSTQTIPAADELTHIPVDDQTVDPDMALSHILHQNRRTAGMGPQSHPHAQYKRDFVRRVCHECGAPFTRSQAYKCRECGHDKCGACQYLPEATYTSYWALGADEMDPPLQRVERKVRQRVRRSCHQCQTTFSSSRDCSNCGHRRCKACPSTPAQRPTLSETRPPTQQPVPSAP